MVPEPATLRLPERGVVVVTGPNGAGKSRFIEACAYALSGKTLRGTTPWRRSEAGSCEITGFDGWSLTRTITAKGTKKTKVSGQSADTNTKTQGWIDIDLDFWRRTHVLSSADAAHFSTSTDKERKDLIEMLLGMDVFDQGYEQALADLRQAEKRVGVVVTSLARAEMTHQFAWKQLTSWQPPPPFEPEPEPVAPGESITAVDMSAWTAELLRVKDELSSRSVPATPPMANGLIQRRYELEASIKTQKSQLSIVRNGVCPQCGADYTKSPLGVHIEQLEHSIGLQERELTGVLTALQHDAQVAQRIEEERRAARAALEERRGQLVAQLARAEVQQRARAQYDAAQAAWTERQTRRKVDYAARVSLAEEDRQRLQAQAEETQAEVDDLKATLTEATREQAEIKLAAQCVRELRGIVLGRALTGIETVANAWLARVAPGQQLRLRPYTDNKTGGTADKISLEIEGAGGGEGYRATSGGERRRVDTALLLALCEVASAASGQTDGTLWMDEVFDALDAQTRPLVAQALADLSRDRTVVIITHLSDLAEQIPCTARYEVAPGGAVHRVV